MVLLGPFEVGVAQGFRRFVHLGSSRLQVGVGHGGSGPPPCEGPTVQTVDCSAERRGGGRLHGQLWRRTEPSAVFGGSPLTSPTPAKPRDSFGIPKGCIKGHGVFVENDIVDLFFRGSLLSLIAMGWVICLVRVVGLRSFSKMTNFDFVMTVAMGSLLAGASQSTQWDGFGQCLVAMGSLFATQYVVARLRKASGRFEAAVSNTPVFLMKDGVVLDEALKESRVARDDLIAKLREANVLEMSKVRAVVLETTGDVSVLHGTNVDDMLLQDIRRVSPR